MKAQRRAQLKLQRKLMNRIMGRKDGEIVSKIILDPLSDEMLFGSPEPLVGLDEVFLPEMLREEADKDPERWAPCPLFDSHAAYAGGGKWIRRVDMPHFWGVRTEIDDSLSPGESYIIWGFIDQKYIQVETLDGDRRWVNSFEVEEVGIRQAFSMADPDWAPEFSLDPGE